MTFLEKVVMVLGILVFMLITGVAKANPVVNWFEAEKKKTIEYQKKSWANSKIQFAKTKESILNLFKSKKNESQD